MHFVYVLFSIKFVSIWSSKVWLLVVVENLVGLLIVVRCGSGAVNFVFVIFDLFGTLDLFQRFVFISPAMTHAMIV